MPAPVTLQKIRQFRNLTEKPTKERIRFGGRFPFKVLVVFRKVIIRTVVEASIFLELLDKEPRIGQTAEDDDADSSTRRSS